MKMRDDPWMTDYLNAIHFAIRYIEVRTHDRRALLELKNETDGLVREALLGNLPMDVYTIRRLAARIEVAERNLAMRLTAPSRRKGSNRTPERPSGDDAAAALPARPAIPDGMAADYRFLQEAFEEFSLDGMIEECRLYFPRIYPDIADLRGPVAELFRREIAAGRIRELRPGVYGHDRRAS